VTAIGTESVCPGSFGGGDDCPDMDDADNSALRSKSLIMVPSEGAIVPRQRGVPYAERPCR
jgi:hypothetical protein